MLNSGVNALLVFAIKHPLHPQRSRSEVSVKPGKINGRLIVLA